MIRKVITNQGVTRTTNKAIVYSGKGIKLDDTQSVALPFASQVQTVVYMKDGLLVYDEQTLSAGNYTLTGTAGGNIFQNVIMYNGTFTTAQKNHLYSYPETFLYLDEGVLCSPVLSPAELALVIEWYPLLENSSNCDSAITTNMASITNYVQSVRDNAKNLEHGLQTMFLNSNLEYGLGLFHGDGTGYADTGWTPSTNWTQNELTVNADNTVTARSYFSDGTVSINGATPISYSQKANMSRIGNLRQDGISVLKLLNYQIYDSKQPDTDYLNYLIANDLVTEDPRVVIDTTGAVDVATLGMVGDGVTDDAAAFQPILDNNAKIYLPAGKVFRINSVVKLNTINTLIYGGGELRFYSGGQLSGAGVKLSGSLTIDGIILNQQTPLHAKESIYLHGAIDNFNTTIQNCTFKNEPTHAHNGVSGFAFANDSKIHNERFINNTFINIGRMAIEVTDRNDNYDIPESSVVGLQVLYNRFLFDPNGGYTVDPDGNHMALSTGAMNDTMKMVGTVFKGNYVENENWGIEITEAKDTTIMYNTIINTPVPFGDVSTNTYIAYNYIEMPQDYNFVTGGINLTIEHNQIRGMIRFNNFTNLQFGYNDFYNVGGSDPINFYSGGEIHVYNNYFEAINANGKVLRVASPNITSASVIENNRYFTNNGSIFVNDSGSGIPTKINNVQVFEKETAINR